MIFAFVDVSFVVRPVRVDGHGAGVVSGGFFRASRMFCFLSSEVFRNCVMPGA